MSASIQTVFAFIPTTSLGVLLEEQAQVPPESFVPSRLQGPLKAGQSC